VPAFDEDTGCAAALVMYRPFARAARSRRIRLSREFSNAIRGLSKTRAGRRGDVTKPRPSSY